MRALKEGAHPDIVEFSRRFIAKMGKVHGVPLFAHNMVRTPEEQRALFVQGVTKAQGGKSPHNYGCAVDIVHSELAWDMDRRSWSMLGHIGKELAVQIGVDIVWGGDWDFYDPAHWELRKWRDLQAGYPVWKGVRVWHSGSRVPLPPKGG